MEVLGPIYNFLSRLSAIRLLTSRLLQVWNSLPTRREHGVGTPVDSLFITKEKEIISTVMFLSLKDCWILSFKESGTSGRLGPRMLFQSSKLESFIFSFSDSNDHSFIFSFFLFPIQGQFVEKGYISGTARWKRCRGQGVGKGKERPCSLRACCSPSTSMCSQPRSPI